MARPTKYKKEYCEKMFDFFNIEHTYEKEITICDKNGNEKTQYIETANQLPTFEKFAVIIGVCRDTLDQWKRERKEFSDTYKMCKDLQKDMLNDLAMRGFYNPTYTIFVAKNITDMTDKQVVENNIKSYSLFESEVERKAAEIDKQNCTKKNKK